jgi:hypothetical protein
MHEDLHAFCSNMDRKPTSFLQECKAQPTAVIDKNKLLYVE